MLIAFSFVKEWREKTIIVIVNILIICESATTNCCRYKNKITNIVMKETFEWKWNKKSSSSFPFEWSANNIVVSFS